MTSPGNDVIYSAIIGLILVTLIVGLVRRMTRAVSWCLSLIVLCQIGYVLSGTALNDAIPFSEVFQTDVMSAVAHLFPGTFIETGLLTAARFLGQIFNDFAGAVSDLWEALGLRHLVDAVANGFKDVYRNIAV